MRRHSLVVVLAVGSCLIAACGARVSGSSGATTNTSVGGPATSVTTGVTLDGLTNRSFTTRNGTNIEYFEVVPPGRTTGVAGKVLITFPPGGQDRDVTQKILSDRWSAEAIKRNWVVVSPAAPSTGLFFDKASADLVPELLDKIASDHPPEGGRFDLAGVSNGGLSAFTAALAHPERFRSLVTFPGNSLNGGNDPQLSKLRDLGVALFVGGDDSGWLEDSQATKATLDKLGYKAELHVVPGQGHIIGGLTGADLFDAMERVRSVSPSK